MKCLSCGNDHDGSFGSGKYCSRACSNRRSHSKEVYDKIAQKLTKASIDLICKECNNSFVANRKGRKFCSNRCARKFTVKSKSEELKIHFRQVAINRYANGDLSIGWKCRSKLEPSYPEKYFIELFGKENISFEREVKCSRYFIDFVLPGKLAVEIDGRSHDDLDVKLKDERKDKILRAHGYEVFRVKWFNPVTDECRDKLYAQINALLVIVANTRPW